MELLHSLVNFSELERLSHSRDRNVLQSGVVAKTLNRVNPCRAVLGCGCLDGGGSGGVCLSEEGSLPSLEGRFFFGILNLARAASGGVGPLPPPTTEELFGVSVSASAAGFGCSENQLLPQATFLFYSKYSLLPHELD